MFHKVLLKIHESENIFIEKITLKNFQRRQLQPFFVNSIILKVKAQGLRVHLNFIESV